jgi:hypothetical protein
MTVGELIEILQEFPIDAQVGAFYDTREFDVTDAGFDSVENVVELSMVWASQT